VCSCHKRALTAREMLEEILKMQAHNARIGYRREPHGYHCPSNPATFHVTGSPMAGRRNYRLRNGKLETTFGL
jgi:hypothetical protein